MKENVSGTSVTVETVSNALQKYFGPSCPKLESVKAEQIGVGQGFTSKIMRVQLTWAGESTLQEKLPKTIILKTVSYETLDTLFEVFSGGGKQNKDSMIRMVNEAMIVEITTYNLLGK